MLVWSLYPASALHVTVDLRQPDANLHDLCFLPDGPFDASWRFFGAAPRDADLIALGSVESRLGPLIVDADSWKSTLYALLLAEPYLKLRVSKFYGPLIGC